MLDITVDERKMLQTLAVQSVGSGRLILTTPDEQIYLARILLKVVQELERMEDYAQEQNDQQVPS